MLVTCFRFAQQQLDRRLGEVVAVQEKVLVQEISLFVVVTWERVSDNLQQLIVAFGSFYGLFLQEVRGGQSSLNLGKRGR